MYIFGATKAIFNWSELKLSKDDNACLKIETLSFSLNAVSYSVTRKKLYNLCGQDPQPN
jgi:hypothetical protein